jgi:hypothetical protein
LVAAVVALAALAAPAGSGARESRPLAVVVDTASNGVTYRVDLIRITERVRGHLSSDLCLRLTFRGVRKKLLNVETRCRRARGFEYRSPSLDVADERDPDKAPLVFGFVEAGLRGVQVALAGGRAPVEAQLVAIPGRFRSNDYVFVARRLDTAPLGVRAIARDGTTLDGALFPAR